MCLHSACLLFHACTESFQQNLLDLWNFSFFLHIFCYGLISVDRCAVLAKHFDIIDQCKTAVLEQFGFERKFLCFIIDQTHYVSLFFIYLFLSSFCFECNRTYFDYRFINFDSTRAI